VHVRRVIHCHHENFDGQITGGVVRPGRSGVTRRKLSKSDVIRERLTSAEGPRQQLPSSLDAITDIVGSVDGLSRDLSARKKKYLKSTGYGDKRAR
jgi:hypothetical protein